VKAAIAARLETGSCPASSGSGRVTCLGVQFPFPHLPLPLSATPFAPRSLPASPLIWRGLTSRHSYKPGLRRATVPILWTSTGISQVHEQAVCKTCRSQRPGGRRQARINACLSSAFPVLSSGSATTTLNISGECPFISPIRPVRSNLTTRFDASVALRARVRSSPLSARL